MNEPRLDAEIDRAVSRMMSVDADPALRARVLSSIARPAPPIVAWTRIAVAGTAVALVVVLAMVLSRTPRRETAPETAAVRQPPAPLVAAPRPPADATRVDRTVAPRTTARGRRVSPAVSADAEPEAPLPAIPALAPIALRAIESIDPHDIDTRGVTVAPLADIPDVHVEPLSFPPPGRS